MDAGYFKEIFPVQPSQASMRQKITGLLHTIKLWKKRSGERRELRQLADDLDVLKDIGLSKYDVQREGWKPFWRD